ncbi:MAG: histidine--tRNA ligase [Thermodesulfobacteriota bacterium]
MIQLIKGFKDILPDESGYWRQVENLAAEIFACFGFVELRPPILERTGLFEKSIGQDTDIVEKEMYTFADRKGDLVTLRPEATASVVRAYIQHQLYAANPCRKLYTIGPMFRRERPQKGRYRQFHQINAEAFGVKEPYLDAQMILLVTTLFRRLGIDDVTVHLNSLGCRQCRPAYKQALHAFLEKHREILCADCRQRLDRNPLRVLDCKVEECRRAAAGAPAIAACLCPECEAHFAAVKTLLTDLHVDFQLDDRLVRGLDYYTRTTFEVQTGSLGAQNAIAGGGRYDELVKMLGGPDQPAVGFAVGCERLIELVRQSNRLTIETGVDLFIAALGSEIREKAFRWMSELQLFGFSVEMCFDERGLKSQMKQADRLGAAETLIIGESELSAGRAVLRNMRTQQQRELPLAGLVEQLKTLLTDPTTRKGIST